MSVYLETLREGFPPKRAWGSGAALLVLEVVLLFPSMDSVLKYLLSSRCTSCGLWMRHSEGVIEKGGGEQLTSR